MKTKDNQDVFHPDISGVQKSEDYRKRQEVEQAIANENVTKWKRFLAFFQNGRLRFVTGIIMLLTGLPLSVLQWSSIILWITRGIWWLFLVWAAIAVLYGIFFSRWYFKKMAYICPECHEIFQPTVRDGFFTRHTYAARRLRCPSCGHHGFCVEVASGSEVKGDA